MFSNFLVSVNAVLPMFLVMAVGMFIKEKGLIDDNDVKKINKLVFMVLLPLLLFSNIYGKDLSEAIEPKLIAYSVLMVLLIYFAGMFVTLKIRKAPKTRGAMIQAIYRSNFVILGIPIVQNIFGSDNLALTSFMVSIIVPMYNVLAVFTLEIFRGSKVNASQLLKKLVTNPLIIGSLLGILSVVIGLKLPVFIESTVSMLAKAATPLALLVLGAFIDFKAIGTRWKDISICVIGKLVIAPIVALPIAVLLGFRDVELITLVAIFASPSAVSSFTMAQQMESDYELAGDAVIISSFFSCFTMFIFIFILKTLGLF